MTTTTHTPRLTLRPEQREAIAAIDAAIARGNLRPLIELPTGYGKTVIFTHWLDEMPDSLPAGGRGLIVAHRKELLGQARDKMLMVDPDADIGIVQADLNEVDAKIVIASISTIEQPHRRQQLGKFDRIIIDEAHHAAARTYREVIDAFDGTPVLGVTATARHNTEDLGEVFPEVVYRRTILEAIQAGHLCDVKAKQVMLEELNLANVKKSRGDYQAGDLERELMRADAPEHTIAAYLEHMGPGTEMGGKRGRKCLLFTPTVVMAHAMADIFREHGIAAEAVDASTPAEIRAGVRDRLASGETMVACNCGIYTEGFDEPSIDGIVLARPTDSLILYQQMIGRGLRLFPGKDNCYVLDTCGTTTGKSLCAMYKLFGVKKEALEEEEMSVLEALGAGRVEEEVGPVRRVASDVDLFFDRHALNWITVDPDTWTLNCGNDGMVVMEAEGGGTWTVAHYMEGAHRQMIRHVLGDGLDLGYAQGMAEDVVRASGGGALVNKKAQWRKQGATVKQIELLQKFRIPYATKVNAAGIQVPDISKGEASDHISLHFAKRDIERLRRRRTKPEPKPVPLAQPPGQFLDSKVAF